jgi:hypothetical protein
MLTRQAFYCLNHASSPFALIIFKEGSHFLLRPAWTTGLLFYASVPPWDDMHVPQHPALFLLRWGLTSIFAQVGLAPWTSQSQPPKKLGIAGAHDPHWPQTPIYPISVSQVARITSMSHQFLANIPTLFMKPDELITKNTITPLNKKNQEIWSTLSNSKCYNCISI